jgi:hypothetical protein
MKPACAPRAGLGFMLEKIGRREPAMKWRRSPCRDRV